MQEKERFEILLEQIESDIRIYGKGQSLLNAKVDATREALDKKIDTTRDELLVYIKAAFKNTEDLKAIVGQNSTTLGEHSTILNKHSTVLNEHTAILKEIRETEESYEIVPR